MYQWIRIESPEINPYLTINRFSTRVPTLCEKNNLFNKWSWDDWISAGKRIK